jgi:prefoldin subunit 5
MKSEMDGLRAQIAELRSLIERARSELYRLSVDYAAEHFRLHSTTQSVGIAALHRSGAEAEASVIEWRCQQLEASIAALKGAIAERTSRRE